jgi:hypothetical protein
LIPHAISAGASERRDGMDDCVKVGSIERLMQYVRKFSRVIVIEPDDIANDPDLRRSNLKFAGLPVIEDILIPQNIIVQIERGKVCRILDIDRID